MSTRVIINPGTGSVGSTSTEKNAIANVAAFIADLKSDEIIDRDHAKLVGDIKVKRTPKCDDGDGRFAFKLTLGKFHVEIDMPGLALSRVRYFNGANPWQFPRLYVNGSSWLWEFAINICRNELSGKTGDE